MAKKDKKVQKAQIIKPKKARKKFPWGAIKSYLKTLFNNEAAMDKGMHSKWYVTLIIFILSMGVSIIPQTVNASKTKGSAYIQSSNDPIALGLYNYATDEASPDIKFENKQASINSSDLKVDQAEPVYTTSFLNEYTKKEVTLLDIYFVNLPETDPLYEQTMNNIRKDNSLNDDNIRTNSFIIFTPTYFESILYNVNSGVRVSGVSGDYKNLNENNANATFKTILKILGEEETLITPTTVLNNFKPFADQIYVNNRNKLTAIQFGIAIGLNAGITLLMGLLIWALTRGKNNPYKSIIKWYHGFGIATWVSITPSLLTLILGFMLTNFGLMFYILFFGVRCMFLSMKNLRPQYQQK